MFSSGIEGIQAFFQAHAPSEGRDFLWLFFFFFFRAHNLKSLKPNLMFQPPSILLTRNFRPMTHIECPKNEARGQNVHLISSNKQFTMKSAEPVLPGGSTFPFSSTPVTNFTFLSLAGHRRPFKCIFILTHYNYITVDFRRNTTESTVLFRAQTRWRVWKAWRKTSLWSSASFHQLQHPVSLFAPLTVCRVGTQIVLPCTAAPLLLY